MPIVLSGTKLVVADRPARERQKIKRMERVEKRANADERVNIKWRPPEEAANRKKRRAMMRITRVDCSHGSKAHVKACN